MSMFTIRGEVVHVFTAPKGVSKSGQEYGGQDKVQILGDIPLKGGSSRKDLITLSTDQGSSLKQMQGRSVSCPVSFFSSNGSVSFFVPEGHKITLLQSA